MLRILHLIDSSGMYGAEIMLLNLMIEQKNMGMLPILLSIGSENENDKQIEKESIKNGIEVKKIQMEIKLNLFVKIKHLKRIIDIIDADIVHSHGYKGNILLGIISFIMNNMPIVCTLHGWTATKKFTKIWFYEKLDQLIVRRFDAMVLVTSGKYGERSKIQFSDQKRNLKIYKIENGIPELSFDSEINELQSLFKKKAFYIGAIGRLSSEKGFEYLIDAMALLMNESNEYSAIIFGDGKLRNKLESKARKLSIEENIIFAGYKEKAYLYMKHFDVLVMPSITEGMPITLLEAMQAGLPVVASKVGGIPTIISDYSNGLLVDPRNPVELAKQISFLKNNPQKAYEIGKNARSTVLKKFTSCKMTKLYNRVYYKVINSRERYH